MDNGGSGRGPVGGAPSSGEAGCCILLRIANFDHVAASFGLTSADYALAGLRAVAGDMCGRAARLVLGQKVVPSSSVAATLVERDSLLLFVPIRAGEQDLAIFVGELMAQVAACVVRVPVAGTEAVELRLLPDAEWWVAPAASDERASAVRRELGLRPLYQSLQLSVPATPRQVEAYRADMEIASAAMSALFDGGLCLAWQAVMRLVDLEEMAGGEGVLYFEALSRFLRGGEGFVLAGEYIGALERTGFVRVLDRVVALRVIDEMETSIADVRLAFNLSGLSAVDDLWWAPFWRALELNPELACRLYIELTETAVLPDRAAALSFASRLRARGVHLVIDSFGAGFTSIRDELLLAPDVVKIPRVFLPGVMGAIRAGDCFEPLALFASAAGAKVVAKHVESPDQMEAAILRGAGWAQGNHLAPVSLLRPWVIHESPSGALVSAAVMDLYRLKMAARKYKYSDHAPGF